MVVVDPVVALFSSIKKNKKKDNKFKKENIIDKLKKKNGIL